MTTDEMKKKFWELYPYMATSENVAYMRAFGNVHKEMMDWMIANKPDLAQEWIEKLCSIKWKNYLTQKEAEKIVSDAEKELKNIEAKIQSANAELERVKAETEREMAQRSAKAQEQANMIVGQAQNQANQILAGAQQQARELIEQESIYRRARVEANELSEKNSAAMAQLRQKTFSYLDEVLGQGEQYMSSLMQELHRERENLNSRRS